MSRVSIIPVMVCLIWSILAASEYRTVRKPVVIDDTYIAEMVTIGEAPMEGVPTVLPPGTVLDSSYWDWQRNGCLNRRIWVNADGTIHATYMKSPDQGFVERGMYYYYADEFSGSFRSFGDVTTFRNGYGNISAYPTTHDLGAIAVLSTHDFGEVKSFAFVDSFQGNGTFIALETNNEDSVLWPKPAVNSGGSIIIVGTLINDLVVNLISNNVAWDRAEDAVTGFSQTWTWLGEDPNDWSDAIMEFPVVASGDNGKVGIVIGDFALDMHYFESGDNGQSFVEILITNAAVDTMGIPSNPDSSATVFLPWINWDIVYSGEEPHIIWTGLQAARAGGIVLYDFRSRILHWSPSTGIDTVVVSPYQSALPSDTTTFLNPGLNHTSIDWPQIGTSPNGEVLYVVYVGFNPIDVDSTSGISFGDIYGVFSTDNGENWSEPINISNPGGLYPGTDDRYPSVSPVNYEATVASGMDAYIVYQSDNTSGSFVAGEEQANIDYLLFTGVDFGSVGIGAEEKQSFTMSKAFALNQNYPNPFNPSSTISFDVSRSEDVRQSVNIIVYDIRGHLVKTLVDSEFGPGNHKVNWEGRNDRGETVSSGIYLYTLKAGGEVYTRKMTLLK
jgi:hypothetical protein